MPLTWQESPNSREPRYGRDGGGEVLRATVLRSFDQVEVFNFAVAQSPTVLDGFIRSNIDLKHSGGGVWKVEVDYTTAGLGGGDTPIGTTPAEPTAPGGNGGGEGGGGEEPLGPGYSIDITADSTHITQSIRTRARLSAGAAEMSGINLTADGGGGNAVDPSPTVVDNAHEGRTVWVTGGVGWTVGSYTIESVDVGNNLWILDRQAAAPGQTGGGFEVYPDAPDNEGAIGMIVTGAGDARVEGTDIFGPRFDWSRDVSREIVTRNYLRILRGLVGKKNAAPFYGSAAGEVLYLGASGRFSEGNKWSLTHKFSEIENQTNVVIVPGQLVIPFKRGWDYLWLRYSRQHDAANNRLVSRPTAAYIEEVCEDGDFSTIGIGF